ncbi:hypothetical protein D3C71_2081500 [compost metagenome]
MFVVEQSQHSQVKELAVIGRRALVIRAELANLQCSPCRTLTVYFRFGPSTKREPGAQVGFRVEFGDFFER